MQSILRVISLRATRTAVSKIVDFLNIDTNNNWGAGEDSFYSAFSVLCIMHNSERFLKDGAVCDGRYIQNSCDKHTPT